MDPPDIASLTLSPSPALPPLSRAHVDRCALPSWLGRFRAHTFKSRVVGPLPQAFVDYLHADGVYLPLDRWVATREAGRRRSTRSRAPQKRRPAAVKRQCRRRFGLGGHAIRGHGRRRCLARKHSQLPGPREADRAGDRGTRWRRLPKTKLDCSARRFLGGIK